MNHTDNIASRILSTIAALPLEQQAQAIHSLIGSALKQMPLESILAMRAEIASEFDHGIAIVGSTLNLIDGQLALREISGAEIWR